MSDDPKNNLNDTDKQKSSSSNNVILLENSDSEPTDVPLFERSTQKFVKDSVARTSKNASSERQSQNFFSDKLATKVFKDDNDTSDLLVGASNENSEPRPLSNVTAASHNSNTSDSQQLYDGAAAEEHKESSISESEDIRLQSSQDNAQFISEDTPNTQGLAVATLVESNRDIFETNIIVDAIVVNDNPIDENPTPWYGRTLLMFGIIVIAAVAVSWAITALIFRKNEPPSANIPTRTSSLSPSSSPTTSNAPSLNPSSRALKALYDSTDGPNWSNTWDFSSGQFYCDFDEINCDRLDQITEIDLTRNNLRGSLPSVIGMLSALKRLDLDSNSITGTIPSEIGILSSLTRFDIDNNSITGTIPSEIGMLSSLTLFYLEDNSITGTIPTELCALTNTKIYYDESEISCTCIDSRYSEGTSCNLIYYNHFIIHLSWFFFV